LPLRVREVLKRFGRQAPLVAWNNFDTIQRRRVLSVVVDHVVVDPMPGSGGRFHPERVEIFWLGQGSVRPSATREVPPPKRRRSRRGERFSTQQAADYLGLNDQYVMRLLRRGDLQGTRGAHGWEITQADIDKFLEQRRLRPGVFPVGVEE
jgi:excisionase family DNA binding protein